MITESENERLKIKKLQNGIRLCEESIAKAEKYERLKENKDWQGYLNDLTIVADQHDKEILIACTMIPDAPSHPYVSTGEMGHTKVISSREDWMNYITTHEIKRAQIRSWLKEPGFILAQAALAREKLPIFKKELKALELVHADTGNGAS
jgi:hypothetical protein